MDTAAKSGRPATTNMAHQAFRDKTPWTSPAHMPKLYINRLKVRIFYIKSTYYMYKQTLLHHELCLFSLTEILAWIKERGAGARSAQMINEVD